MLSRILSLRENVNAYKLSSVVVHIINMDNTLGATVCGLVCPTFGIKNGNICITLTVPYLSLII